MLRGPSQPRNVVEAISIRHVPNAVTAVQAPATQMAIMPAKTNVEVQNVTWSDELTISSEHRFSEEIGSATRILPSSVLTAPDAPQVIARQITVALQRSGEKVVNLTLNPAELGKVRISLSTTDSGVAVMITADRPETLDLMRRNADVLAQEFHNIGYGSAQFEFGQNNPGKEHAHLSNSEQPGTDTMQSETDEEPQSIATILLTDRVDIRI